MATGDASAPLPGAPAVDASGTVWTEHRSGDEAATTGDEEALMVTGTGGWKIAQLQKQSNLQNSFIYCINSWR